MLGQKCASIASWSWVRAHYVAPSPNCSSKDYGNWAKESAVSRIWDSTISEEEEEDRDGT
jgi:hypothetical protein